MAEHGTDQPSAFGPLLRDLRTRAGSSQQATAARAGISARALRDLEHGRVRRPREQTVRRLADALGLSAGETGALRAAAARGGEADGPPEPGRTTLLVLGPLSLRRGRDTVPVGSPTLRRLLGLLALAHPAAATRQEITDTLWPSGPPDSQQSLIHTYVSQLRRLLDPEGPAPAVARTPAGYRLDLPRHRIDLGRFDELLARTTSLRHAPDPDAAHQDLTRALRWWRGPVLADADPVLRRHPAAVAANERRIRAALLHADTALLLRRPDHAVPLLRELAHTEPLHEGLHARLVLTLAASGRQDAALDAYARLRARLDEELGVTPGPELQDAHLRVLRGHPRTTPAPAPASTTLPVPVPAQLSSPPRQFVGRDRQLRELDALLPAAPADGSPLVAVVGPPGVGKSALVAHWAHGHRDRFPDGRLHADLRGHADRPPARPDTVLARFLRALGTPPDRLPADPDEAAALYRTLLADRRLLIVLDDARDAAQVRPLLPGAPGCTVLVTGRGRLTGLLAGDGARRLTLDPLDPAEGSLLLGTVLGPSRVAAEPAAARRLVHACGGLPLALRIAAADLTTRGTALTDYAPARPDAALLARLDLPDDPHTGLRVAFDRSYRALPAPARHLFRLLGHAPAAGLTAETAATLAATTPAETATQLARLADAHLLHERPPGHYRLPGLLHPYAAGLPDETGRPLDVNQLPDAKRASDLDRDPEHNQLIDLTRTTDRKVLPLLTPSLSRTPSLPRTPARQPQPGPYPDDITVLGLICWKLGRLPEAADHFAHAARLLGAPSRDDGPGGAADREDRDREDRDREDADREAIARTNLAVVQRALGRPAEAIRLLGETLPVHRRHHNRFSAAVALTCLSAAHTDLGDHATGQLLAHSALTAARAVRHRALQANAQLALAESHFTARRTAEAAAAHREALALAEASGDRHPQAAALAGLAAALLDTDPRAALRTAERALALARAAEFRVLEGEALTVLTRVRARLGDPHTALSLGRDALARQRETGHRPGEARAHLALAQAAAALGSDAEAVRHRREALLITRAAAGSIPPN